MIAAHAPGLVAGRTRLTDALLRAADLDGANFDTAVVADTTFATSSLRRAIFSDADFEKVDLGLTNLAGAHLDGVDAGTPPEDKPSSLFLADLTGASLADSTWADDESGERPWRWAILCGTAMPPGVDDGDRDCPR